MPIHVTCAACGKRLKARESLAGKVVRCPHCGEKVRVPEPEAEGIFVAYPLESAAPAQEPLPDQEEAAYPVQETDPAPRREVPRRARKRASLPSPTVPEPPAWLRHLHWLLALALVPLAFSLLQPEKLRDEFDSRLQKTLEQAPAKVQRRAQHVRERVEEGTASLDDLFATLPGHRLVGSFLPRSTWLHWLFAAGAALLFMTFFLFLAAGKTADPRYLLGIALFTSTGGIFLLFVVQTLASLPLGLLLWGDVAGLSFILKLIGFSYQAALDPGNGFILSFLGFTLGVGLCEEVCKALPLLVHFRRPSGLSWRGAFLWGLASGAGFGIAEGIVYSSRYYNGIVGPNVYLVRFISCVALHALWTGSAAITLYRNQDLIQNAVGGHVYLVCLFRIIGVPVVLHGLYDTLLKKELNGPALGVAVLSFLFLAFQISRLHGGDDEAAREERRRASQRRRAALS